MDSSLTIMIKTLGLIYRPDIDEECKDNIQDYLYKIYFEGDDSQTQKDFVYNAIKNFAEMNHKAYQSSNLIELMNEIVQERRGDIFVQNHSPGERSRGIHMDSHKTSSDFGKEPMSSHMKRTGGALRKSIM